MNEASKNIQYEAETILPLITTLVPTCKKDDNLETISKILIENPWKDMNYIFVLENDRKLIGFINVASLSQTNKKIKAEDLLKTADITLKPGDKRQKAVILAVKNDIDIIPVVDTQKVFLGAIISATIIDLLHSEHLENILATSGLYVKKHHLPKIASAGIFEIVRYRLPWLIFGLIIGLGLGLISSGFEEQLQKNIAVAYFIPVVAYIADSVGTQSEAITVRTLATVKINALLYLLRELLIGVVVGSVIGVLGGLGAFIITTQSHIGVVVGLSLFVASAVASILASFIPILFKTLDKDPALGSGPLATAIQDIISVFVYFIFVSLLL